MIEPLPTSALETAREFAAAYGAAFWTAHNVYFLAIPAALFTLLLLHEARAWVRHFRNWQDVVEGLEEKRHEDELTSSLLHRNISG